MIYDNGTPGDGQWHCPYTRDWVERMARASKHCYRLSAEQIEASDNSQPGYKVPPGDFLDGPQDVRGLPLWWCAEEERRFREYPVSCCAIYDYDTVPDVVITNGKEDWSLRLWEPVFTA